jgi:hypothetical protein
MTQDYKHQITPTPELVQEWCKASRTGEMHFDVDDLATRAAQWGADQELEGCCEWLDRNNQWARCDIDELRDGRRPRPPSLKEQALAVLEEEPEDSKELIVFDTDQVNSIRRALEQLDD